jgi:hypothetical protein
VTLNAIANTLWAVGLVVAVAWAIESFPAGRGGASTYLAPLAFGLFIAAGLIRLWVERPNAAAARQNHTSAEPLSWPTDSNKHENPGPGRAKRPS